MSKDQYDQLLKCIVIGDVGTGKSCILQRFTEGKFIQDHTHTIGVEFGAKVIDIDGQRVKMQIWDTAGQERYRAVTRSYYKGAVACLLVFDLTNRESYVSVQKWLHDARQYAGPDIAVMLVGNKTDLAFQDRRRTTTEEATLLATQNGMLYFETSAATGEHIDDAFHKLASTVVSRNNAATAAKPKDTVDVTFDDTPTPKKKGCSC